MVPTERDAGLTMDEALSDIRSMVDMGQRVVEAADYLVRWGKLSTAALDECAVEGLRTIYHLGLHHERERMGREADEIRDRLNAKELADHGHTFDPLARHPECAKCRALRMIYDGADGRPKELAAFTRADASALAAKAEAQVIGWARKRDAMKFAVLALDSEAALTIGDLSEDARHAIVEAL